VPIFIGMTDIQIKKLLKEEIRRQLGESATDEMVEGMLDRMKAKAKGAVAGVKGAAGAVKDKALGKGKKGQSFKDTVKQGYKKSSEKVATSSIVGKHFGNISKEFSDFQNDMTKLLKLEPSKSFNEFIANMQEIDPDLVEPISKIYITFTKLKQQEDKKK